MNSIYVCFSLKSFTTGSDSNDLLEKNYLTVYKPLVKFLYTHKEFPFSFSFTGQQLQFYKKRKNELIQILRELAEREQIEVIGGSYYDSILPIIYSIDRNYQIDTLSAEIRQTVGKRARGMFLFEDCWDPSLVNNIHTCGIEYVMLENSLLPEDKQKYLPVLMSDLSKTVEIMPYSDSLVPGTETTPKEFIDSIIKAVSKIEKNDEYVQMNADRIVNICLNQVQITKLINAKWFENLITHLKAFPNEKIKFSTPYAYTKISDIKQVGYVPSGISNRINQIISKEKTDKLKNSTRYSVYDFLELFPVSNALYNRVLYLSMLVNQYKNDKMRKKAARDKILEAQTGMSILGHAVEPHINTLARQNAYKTLIEAELYLREEKFKENITSFDYNNDGLKEYVCRMQNYFANISLISGSVQELDVFKCKCNYVDNILRKFEYDGYSDDYRRGLFIDHFFNNEQFKKYINNEPAGTGVFSKIRYYEVNYTRTHHEIHLCASAFWGPSKQKVYLRKKYIINSTGMYVQYIIRNESKKKLNAKFAVESNFSHYGFVPGKVKYFSVEAVDKGQKLDINPAIPSKKLIDSEKLQNTQIVRLTDSENGVSFVFEPNEKSGYCYSPLYIKRPDSDSSLKEAALIYVSTIYWDLDIEPGMETEKSINFTIVPVKKTKNV